MPATFARALVRVDSASCFQPSGVFGGVSQAVRSGCAMIFCNSGLTVSGTGMVLAGTLRGASGASDCAKAPDAGSSKETARARARGNGNGMGLLRVGLANTAAGQLAAQGAQASPRGESG